jgi:uncharacterized membrane protein YdbT with pleckstrin-like domain
MSSYVDQVLVAGEHIVHQGKPSLWGDWLLWAVGIVTMPIVLGVFILIAAYFRYKSTELVITNKRIIAKFGFITRRTTEIQLNKVESIAVEQGMVGRLLNFGTLTVTGTGASFAPIPNVSDPLQFRKKFVEAADQSK